MAEKINIYSDIDLYNKKIPIGNVVSQDIKNIVSSLQNQRSGFDAENNYVSVLFSPYKKFFQSYISDWNYYWNNPLNTSFERYSSLVFSYLENFIFFISELIASPNNRWFKITYEENEQTNRYNLQQKIPGFIDTYILAIEKYLYNYLNTINFYKNFEKVLSDCITFGYGAFYLPSQISSKEIKDGYIHQLEYVSCENIYFYLNSLSQITIFFTRNYMSKSQILNKFNRDSDNIPGQILSSNDKIDSQYSICHYVGLINSNAYNKQYIVDSSVDNFKCIYYFESTGEIIREENWRTIPYFVSRWIQKGNYSYAHGQPTQCIDEVLTLNRISRTDNLRVETAVSPAVLVSEEDLDGFDAKQAFIPRAITYRNSFSNPNSPPIMRMLPETNLNQLIAPYQEVLQVIQKSFYADLIQLRSGTKTATEVDRLNRDSVVFLQSRVMQIFNDTLVPFLQNILSSLLKARVFDNIIENVNDIDINKIKFNFNSSMIFMQQQNEITNLNNFYMNTVQLVGSIPGGQEKLMKLDIDDAMNRLRILYNQPSTVFKKENQLQNETQSVNEQISADKQLEQQIGMSEVAKNITPLIKELGSNG